MISAVLYDAVQYSFSYSASSFPPVKASQLQVDDNLQKFTRKLGTTPIFYAFFKFRGNP